LVRLWHCFLILATDYGLRTASYVLYPCVMDEQIQTEQSGRPSVVKMMVFLIIVTIVAGIVYYFRDSVSRFVEDTFKTEKSVNDEMLVIAYAEGLTSFDPANYDVRNRKFLGNIYEGLTRFDKNLALEPCLAISWGQIDQFTWEFKLRDEVYFHDGTIFDSADVLASINYAMDDENSQMMSVLSSIENVEATDDLTVLITTNKIDPILPNRLAYINVFPSDEDVQDAPIGTGPYSAISYNVSSDSGDSELVLRYFSYYWGFKPSYESVKIVSISDSEKREEALLNGEIDVLANVAPESVADLETAGISVVTQPSLEVNFFLFNTESVFEDVVLREAFAMAVDTEDLVSGFSEYAQVADQFVGKGVSGYDSTIKMPAYDADGAKSVFEENEVFDFSIAMADGMEELGGYLQAMFAFGAGVEVNAEYLSAADLTLAMTEGSYDVYFTGWKSELGDAVDLYETVFHSKDEFYGAYNVGYENSEVDELIEESFSESDSMERISILKEIMHILIEEDLAGVPLFESKFIYGFSEGVSWSSRVDGYILAAEF